MKQICTTDINFVSLQTLQKGNLVKVKLDELKDKLNNENQRPTQSIIKIVW